jgi:EAL domain-containing protein (putative c-di-GMP-specific phosphodiesterase class I)
MASVPVARDRKKNLRWTLQDGDPADEEVSPQQSVRSLTTSQIGVVFQPIVSLSTGKIFAHEALVRCKVPEFANPVTLFNRAVEERSCGRLGRLIRDVAFSGAPELPLFVNLHPDELRTRWLVRPDDPICFHRQGVYLEVTESATIDYFDLCVSILAEVCSRTGAKLVVDDFGAGYSNLKRLIDLEPAVVKLDRALIAGLDRSGRQRTLVRQIARLCSELDASVVAEGVETEGELSALFDLGVDYAQGYFIARPGFPAPHVELDV